jgi:hypothetical protein
MYYLNFGIPFGSRLGRCVPNAEPLLSNTMTHSFLAPSGPLKIEEESGVVRAILSGGQTVPKRLFGTNIFKRAENASCQLQ